MNFGAPLIKISIFGPLYSFWKNINIDVFEESNGPQLIFCHVSSNQLHELPEQRYVIFSKILPHRIIVKAMQIVLQNKCANHFCHFFYKKNKKCGTLQKRLANLRFLLVYLARNSTRATDRRHSLQTHFVIHVLICKISFCTFWFIQFWCMAWPACTRQSSTHTIMAFNLPKGGKWKKSQLWTRKEKTPESSAVQYRTFN